MSLINDSIDWVTWVSVTSADAKVGLIKRKEDSIAEMLFLLAKTLSLARFCTDIGNVNRSLVGITSDSLWSCDGVFNGDDDIGDEDDDKGENDDDADVELYNLSAIAIQLWPSLRYIWSETNLFWITGFICIQKLIVWEGIADGVEINCFPYISVITSASGSQWIRSAKPSNADDDACTQLFKISGHSFNPKFDQSL